MIAVSSKGKSFRALAAYLATGRSGDNPERVAWSTARNLPTDDPQLAALIMRATAEQSQRVQKPVYHLVLSFDPTDSVDRAMMERIADRVLSKLTLHDHQVVIVAHHDRAHPHLHLLVNRVHPTTGVAWDLSHDYQRIQAILRETERECGLREVPGRFAASPDRERPERAAFTPGEYRQSQRGDAVFIEHVRTLASEFRHATSWDGLEARLARHGLHLERKGQGLIVTDGMQAVKASRIARDLSLRGLEHRYGVPYDERHVASAPTRLLDALRDARRYAYVRDLTTQQYDTELAAIDARGRLAGAHWAIQHDRPLTRQIAVTFARIYRDPSAAQTAFVRHSHERDIREAIAVLRDTPERYGGLRTTREHRLAGLITREHDTPERADARRSADVIVTHLREDREHARHAADAARDAHWADRRAAQARAALTGLPTLQTLEHTLTQHAARLLPQELQRLQMVMAPHKIVIPTPSRAIRALVRGDDDRER